MDSIDCMASIDCYSFSEHILVYVFVSLIGVYMSRGGPTRTAYSIFWFKNEDLLKKEEIIDFAIKQY